MFWACPADLVRLLSPGGLHRAGLAPLRLIWLVLLWSGANPIGVSLFFLANDCPVQRAAVDHPALVCARPEGA